MKNKIEFEPYQPFFFSGLLISILGLLLWLFYQMGWLSYYPQQEHAFLMVMGFLLAYISGFLMTAVPKMSQTQSAQTWEVGTGVGLLWLQVAIALSGNIRFNYWVGILQLAFLLLFIFRRIKNRKANPPMGFVFLPFGLSTGLVGCVLLSFPELPVSWQVLGKGFLYQSFVLNLILGLGSRLIPALTRVQGALDVRAAASEKASHYIILAVALMASFVVEAFLSPSLGQFLKFFIIAWMAFSKFRILKPRQTPGNLGTGIRVAVYFLAFGFLLSGLFPSWSLHFLHLSYIGGFALLTFFISTRVVLAHGGYDLSLELKSPHLLFFLGLIGMVALLRACMGFDSNHRIFLIWFLVAAWLLLVTVWSHFYLGKLWKSRFSK